MNNIDQFVTMFVTILSGVFVFVIGQFILELIIKPLKEYRNLKSHLTGELKYYSNIICNPLPHNLQNLSNELLFKKYIETGDVLRRLSCDLEAKYYDNHSLIRKWIIKDNVASAGTLLIKLSNGLFSYSDSGINHAILNSDDLDKLKKYLNLRIK